jgi:uncharacterized glyoxalase superfamily metalloenzyme YdcJ
MHLYRWSFVAGLAIGFVAGTRAGREKYDQMLQVAKATKENPTVQQAASTIQSQATTLLNSASQKMSEVAPQLAHSAAHKVDGLRHRNGHGHEHEDKKSKAQERSAGTPTDSRPQPSDS